MLTSLINDPDPADNKTAIVAAVSLAGVGFNDEKTMAQTV